MAKVSYQKPHLSYAEQRQKLLAQGMVLDLPDAQVEHFLSHLNYYRLSGYWYGYRENGQKFKPNTRFSDILALYQFDKSLRILLLDAIEQIEVSIRTKLAYHLGAKYGAHALLDASLFSNSKVYHDTLAKLTVEVSRSREEFILHLAAKYHEPVPPIWAAVEVMSMGQLSSWFKNLKTRQDALAIADNYELDSKVLTSFLHHLTILRNHCAHHARVWHKHFTFKLQLPSHKPHAVIEAFQTERQAQSKIYNTLVMMAWVLNKVQPEHDWLHRLTALLDSYPQVNRAQMGFPANWQAYPIWKS
ncbi:Abi family protein [Thiomicrospira cyclica]|uniref:Abi family protein n=1 Tax=Thiomicrospira cyclica (strain DSM 14477 / JCM 11371 / ALM1) TaxID=717773 RepID=F6D9T5_THICA|nr:Abi family protein [Thiomicrospira cyclica]AEG32134.1 Abi family protein [Thiomicrospira cyclica ALM1]